ncbi:hypothetical protein NQ318_004516 [Aromia moschata]|uniref:Mos1 transposase HTH domain-containing protein n=1 Tax=Aromia moschata TaxID=1265417 RepID=A0AAV8Y4W1_9CUCU|nr:hypothetical protein NQ318_004516 [Aromia moschata]
MSVNFFPETWRVPVLYVLGLCDPVQEKMQRSLEQRMAIKLCVKLEKSAAETIPMLKKVFGVDCLSDRQVFRWHKAGKKVGKMSTTRTTLDGHQPPVPTTM